MRNRVLFILITILSNALTVSAQSWLWGVQGNSGLKDDVFGSNLATDKTGNVYQTGGFSESITFGNTTLYSSISSDAFFLVKYDQNSNLLWAKGAINDTAGSGSFGYSVAADDSDNVYVTGFISDTTTFGSITLNTPSGEFFLGKFKPDGNVTWIKGLCSSGGVGVGSTGYALAEDKLGHEYVLGFNYLTGKGELLIKYDRNGNVIWSLPLAITTHYYIKYNLTTDIPGNIYVTGLFQDSLKLGSYKLYSPNQTTFIAKFDGSGNVLWAQQVVSGNPVYLSTSEVTVDASGAVYLTDRFSDTISVGPYVFKSPKSVNIYNNFFVVKYDSNGTIVWAKSDEDVNNSAWVSMSICADESHNIYLSGGIDLSNDSQGDSSSFIFSNDTVSIKNPVFKDEPAFLFKLDSSGNVTCSSTLDAGGDGYGNAWNVVTADSTGQFVYMGGIFTSTLVIDTDSLIDNTAVSDSYIGRWKSCNVCDIAVNIAPQPATVCSGQSVTLIATGGATYTWSPATTLSSSTGDSVIATPSVQTTYTVTGSNSLGCSATGTDVVSIADVPAKPTIMKNGDVLTSSATQGNQWMRNDTILQGATNQTYTVTMPGYYQVITDNPANGCSSKSDSDDVTTGIDDLPVNSGQWTVYPNPTSGEIMVGISSSAEDVPDWSLKIYDVLGRTVYSKRSLNYNNEIDISNLSSGVYFISVMNKTGKTILKVVKND